MCQPFFVVVVRSKIDCCFECLEHLLYFCILCANCVRFMRCVYQFVHFWYIVASSITACDRTYSDIFAVELVKCALIKVQWGNG